MCTTNKVVIAGEGRGQAGGGDAEVRLNRLSLLLTLGAALFFAGIAWVLGADGTPLNYTLVNIRDWCKNTFEVVNQLRINTDYSHHRYDVILLINGVPCVQVELKTLGISPRRAMEQIVDYKHDPGNGYTKTLLCFIQLFIVSNRDSTYYFANNNARHFAFNADERCDLSLLVRRFDLRGIKLAGECRHLRGGATVGDDLERLGGVIISLNRLGQTGERRVRRGACSPSPRRPCCASPGPPARTRR